MPQKHAPENLGLVPWIFPANYCGGIREAQGMNPQPSQMPFHHETAPLLSFCFPDQHCRACTLSAISLN